MDDSSIDESLFTTESGVERTKTMKNKKKKKTKAVPTAPPPPATIALPIKNEEEEESVEDYTNNYTGSKLQPQPFDEPHVDDDVPSDISCGVDNDYESEVMSNLLQNKSSKVPSDEEHLEEQEEQQLPLISVSIPTPPPNATKTTNTKSTTTPKQHSAEVVAAVTPSLVKDTTIEKSSTPETQASPSSPEANDFMDAYSHAGPDNMDDHVNVNNTNKRLFDVNDTFATNPSLLEEGKTLSYQKPIGSSKDGNDDLSDDHDDDSKNSSSSQRNHHKRYFLWCFLFSLVMIAAATGVAVYMLVFKDGSGGRKSNAVVGPPTLAPSSMPSSEPTAPTASPAPSLAPSASGMPSDLP
ncbi:MAG: hypothetical protein SGILL_008722, partial [Bacillariaceae sp.]